MLAKPSFFIRLASRAPIRWLRDADRPPRRSLSNELLIARGTPPNLGGEFLLQAPHKWPISRPRARARGFLSKRSQPRRGERVLAIFRPSGAAFQNDTYPGLAPGATLCRRSAAEYAHGF